MISSKIRNWDHPGQSRFKFRDLRHHFTPMDFLIPSDLDLDPMTIEGTQFSYAYLGPGMMEVTRVMSGISQVRTGLQHTEQLRLIEGARDPITKEWAQASRREWQGALASFGLTEDTLVK
jgi:hypothetical protein